MKKKELEKFDLGEFLYKFEKEKPALYKVVMGIVGGLILSGGIFLAFVIIRKIIQTSLTLSMVIAICCACVCAMFETD